MIKNIFKNFVAGSATRPYPIEVRPGFDNARGELANDIDGCNLCGICAKKCPSQCICVDRKGGTWELNPFACVFCGVCVESCPKKCLTHSPDHKKPVRRKAGILLKKETVPKPKLVSGPV